MKVQQINYAGTANLASSQKNSNKNYANYLAQQNPSFGLMYQQPGKQSMLKKIAVGIGIAASVLLTSLSTAGCGHDNSLQSVKATDTVKKSEPKLDKATWYNEFNNAVAQCRQKGARTQEQIEAAMKSNYPGITKYANDPEYVAYYKQRKAEEAKTNISPEVWYNSYMQYKKEYYANLQMVPKIIKNEFNGQAMQVMAYPDDAEDKFNKKMQKEHPELLKYFNNPEYSAYADMRDKQAAEMITNQIKQYIDSENDRIAAQNERDFQRQQADDAAFHKRIEEQKQQVQRRIDAGDFSPRYVP